MPLFGLIKISIQVGDPKARVWFGVIDGLEGPEILGTSFIDIFSINDVPSFSGTAKSSITPNQTRKSPESEVLQGDLPCRKEYCPKTLKTSSDYREYQL